MQGVGAPHLIVRGGNSPHIYALRPSDARALQNAQVVFWVGEALERFLEAPLKNLSGKARIVKLMSSHDLTLHNFREAGPWDAHDDRHGEALAHAHGSKDPHIWLDPLNAKAMVREIVNVLAAADPVNARTYKKNGTQTLARLDDLTKRLESRLMPLRGKPFVVFHDAYQYFEKRFTLIAAGSVTVSPDKQPGAARVDRIEKKIRELGAVCIFTEPQFAPKLVTRIIEDTGAHAGILDPLGAGLASGPELYFRLMEKMGDAVSGCLQEEG